MNATAKIEPATVRILQTETYRLSEIIKAMFGNVQIEIDIKGVEQEDIDFMNELSGHKQDSAYHIRREQGFAINLTSKNEPLPF